MYRDRLQEEMHRFVFPPDWTYLLMTTYLIYPFIFFSISYRALSSEEEVFNSPTQHSVLYNAMIHPFLNITIFGAIWYQGEANSRAPDTYNCTFPAMIDDWRIKWFAGSHGNTNKTFPFGFVQVSNLSTHHYGYWEFGFPFVPKCRKAPWDRGLFLLLLSRRPTGKVQHHV